ncbi:fimbrial protein [Serratia bockelmannii]|uniref:fimbrial protein n=1 Tax=Serratia bockelmannii TaxID=2703793 RepID=UPI00384F9DE8
MNGTTRYRRMVRGLVGLLSAVPLLALAANTATVTVKVTVVAPPQCTINDNNPIQVEFGDVMTSKVDGSNYNMPVNYTLTCKSGGSNAMKLQVKGTGASFNSAVLKTNKTGLGIKLLQGSSKSALAINTWLNFSYPSKPALWAVPVKQSGATLTAGEFSAASTMMVDYQ